MKRFPLFLLAGLVAGSAGCTIAPRYERPEAPVATQWPSGQAYPVSGDSEPLAAEVAWRDFISDGKLRRLVDLALANNRDLRSATLNVELARAIYRVQRDSLFPALTASAGGGRQHTSAELTQPNQPRTTESYSISAGILAWEIDVFGRMRSMNRAALERFFATREARRGAQTLLVSGVADAYLALAADRDSLALAESTLQSQQAAYDLVGRQHAAGVATELDLRQAQVPLETARSSVAQFTRLVAQDENALALLLGGPVPAELLPSGLAEVAAFAEIRAGLPSEVLLQRPDVMQAEAELRAANADVGAARAAFLPRISLTTTLGTGSRELSGLFGTDNDTWSFLPGATMPIFDARTWTAHRGAQVQRELAVTHYERSIQSAFREVADTLAARGTLGEQLAAQERLVEALAETLRLATTRFEHGVDSYFAVLDAQRSLFSARQGLVSLRLAHVANRVRLYAVLGGGGDETAAAP